MTMTLIIIASMFIWIYAINELIKPSKKQNNRKIITLISFGSLSTLIITVSLFQSLPFFN
ncbi:hypothetical protein [Amphibacillus xylanus]|uniref:Uncharacterized protein n=1 Tax=Amphibacillus xylanus (strain ATCC 51415 / DSM 6626 / JCM 7361 / LMG 17667 / NBRC 15112 / Ep01) TaxID=698758 RepID=K0J0A8_AMPXN|nr:hypothetical protein [Amphibacillus xylanus]BAM46602.1 hypothetical protein AXY_04700 [Amphibacillus xylanus NBRC 15112]